MQQVIGSVYVEYGVNTEGTVNCDGEINGLAVVDGGVDGQCLQCHHRILTIKKNTEHRYYNKASELIKTTKRGEKWDKHVLFHVLISYVKGRSDHPCRLENKTAHVQNRAQKQPHVL